MRKHFNLHKRIRALERRVSDEFGVDEYGRSKARLRRREEIAQKAFVSLTPEQQHKVRRACAISQKYEEKAIAWENQPEVIKRASPLYDLYMAHSKICRHAFLQGQWETPEEKKIGLEAAHIMILAERPFDPDYKPRGIH